MGSVPPVPVLCSYQRRVNLIHKLRRLPRTAAFFAQKSACHSSQVGEHQIKQFVFDCAIPRRPSPKQPSNVAVLFQHGPLRNVRIIAQFDDSGCPRTPHCVPPAYEARNGRHLPVCVSAKSRRTPPKKVKILRQNLAGSWRFFTLPSACSVEAVRQ